MQQINNNLHEEPKLFWFSKLLELGQLPFFKQVGLLISLIFIRVAPEIPVSLKKSYTGPDGLRASIIGSVLTFFFALVVNIIWTFANGTLIGNEKGVIYFFHDWWNLALYTFVCPIYVGLTCWLVVVVIKGWAEINEFKDKELSNEIKRNKFKIVKAIALGMLVLSVAFILTTNYINDVISLVDQNKFYWFLSKTNEGEYEVRALGVYYFLLNFTLLIITLIALTFFMSIYTLIMNVGKALEAKRRVGKLEFKTLQIKLKAFTEAYIITKGIIAAYVVNIWIWSGSPLAKGTAENFIIAIILLTIIGVFIISFPRYFVELQWYKLNLRSPNSDIMDHKYQDLRTFEIKNIAHILDILFIGGFTLYTIQYIVGLT